jgi:hypothetical protein
VKRPITTITEQALLWKTLLANKSSKPQTFFILALFLHHRHLPAPQLLRGVPKKCRDSLVKGFWKEKKVYLNASCTKKGYYLKVFNSVVLDDPRKTVYKTVNRGSRETEPSQVYFG